MRTLFLGSGPFGLPALERLTALRDDVVVATVPDARQGRSGTPQPTVIRKRATELGLEVRVIDSLKGAGGPQFLAATGASLVVTADFRLILGEPFLESAQAGCWNLHGSLLPRWRGAAPVARAILAGDETFGVTLYRMVAAVDAGPVLSRRSWTPEGAIDTVEAEAHVAVLAADLLEESLPLLESADFDLEEQDEDEATKAPKLKKEEGWIDWAQPAEQIERQIRALRPWPRTFSHLLRAGEPKERLFIVAAVAPGEQSPEVSPGTVVEAGAAGVRVACGSGQLLLSEVQREGRRPMNVEVLLRGFPIAAGDRFLGVEEGEGE